MKLRLPNLLPRKKLRAATARRSLALPDDMEFEEMAEPNMKLSRALLIVLVLHVVAVAGIVAFNTIKTRQAAFPGPAPAVAKASDASAVAANGEKSDSNVVASEPGAAKHDASKPVRGAEKIVAKVGPKGEPAKAGEKPSAAPAGAKSYIVAKGDNPAKIAKKLKVSYVDLLAVNHIDDPHKLQIGQKLIVPVKVASKAKKSDG
ncbi:MAG: LysM peptidoglycan-binding domain-containing protein [Verrucomicrobiota bacterium]|nr:LysM peptidoglycan-binding domain-containing protein [Verrucomicrobiota bacterium]